MTFTVALIGPDGAGKTTIARRLEQTLPLPVRYLYMGVNADASNRMLPTTRMIRRIKHTLGARPDTAGPRDLGEPTKPGGWCRRVLRSIKRGAGLVNRLAEEWYRQWLTWSYCRRGYVVLFDRHYLLDYHAYDIAAERGPRSLSRRVHGYLLRFYPRPDLVIYLDAPGEVLFARKGEGTPEALDRRRADYLRIREVVEHFIVVDAAGETDEVAQETIRSILDFHRARQAGGGKHPVQTPHDSCPLP